MSFRLVVGEKKLKILQAAVRVFSSKGFHQAKMGGMDAGQFLQVNPLLVAQLFFGAVHIMGMPLVFQDEERDLRSVSAGQWTFF